MNQTAYLASAIAYGVALGYLFTLAIGHMFALWQGPDWLAHTVRIGAVAWIALILLSAWTASRWSSNVRDPRSPQGLRGLYICIAVLGLVTGIVVADSLLSVVSLTVGASIRITSNALLAVICLAWLAFGTTGAVLATRFARRRIRLYTSKGTDF